MNRYGPVVNLEGGFTGLKRVGGEDQLTKKTELLSPAFREEVDGEQSRAWKNSRARKSASDSPLLDSHVR